MPLAQPVQRGVRGGCRKTFSVQAAVEDERWRSQWPRRLVFAADSTTCEFAANIRRSSRVSSSGNRTATLRSRGVAAACKAAMSGFDSHQRLDATDRGNALPNLQRVRLRVSRNCQTSADHSSPGNKPTGTTNSPWSRSVSTGWGSCRTGTTTAPYPSARTATQTHRRGA